MVVLLVCRRVTCSYVRLYVVLCYDCAMLCYCFGMFCVLLFYVLKYVSVVVSCSVVLLCCVCCFIDALCHWCCRCSVSFSLS